MDDIETLKSEIQQLYNALAEKQNGAAVSTLMPSFMHEINNLIGVGVTASSVMETLISKTDKLFEENELKRSDLSEFLSDMGEASRLVSVNLQHMAELIRSFKQVVMDQSLPEIRQFRLKNYLDEIIFSLRPKLRKTPHTVTVTCDPSVEMFSFAGAISPIIINFVLNSLIHGFREGQAGNIEISARVDDQDWVVLTYVDDGKGLSEEHFPTLFDPYFSTHEEGSTGLGLFAVHNLVTEHLKGTIEAWNEKGKGLMFKIHIPRKLIF